MISQRRITTQRLLQRCPPLPLILPSSSEKRLTATARETKPSSKTTELIVYLVSVLGVLIASWVVDVNEDGQRFSAYQGWFLVTLLTIGYLISRGLAKSGSRDPYTEDRDER